MSLQVPSYPNPFDPTTPITNAYAWVGSLAVNFASGTGVVTVFVHPSAAAANAGAGPLAQFQVALGQPLAGGVTFYSLAGLQAAALAAQQATPSLSPFDALRAALYDGNQGLKAHPLLAGSTDVP